MIFVVEAFVSMLIIEIFTLVLLVVIIISFVIIYDCNLLNSVSCLYINYYGYGALRVETADIAVSAALSLLLG